MFIGSLIYGFINSSVLALLAMGFNLTFGISGVANFAYGAIYIFSGFLCWICIHSLGLPYFLSVVLAILCAVVVGILIYYLIIVRVKGLALSEVMATFGLGLAIMELFRYFNFVGFRYTLPVFFDGSVSFGDVYVDYQRLIIALSAIGLTAFIFVFTRYTKIGLAFRAIAQDERTALTFGIDSDFIGALSMAFGSGLGAVAAIVVLPLGTIAVEGGYEVLINLALLDSPGALPNEGTLVTVLGLQYFHIPVVWESPQPSDLDQFFKTMQRNQNRKVFVHCVLNMRVSVFVFLYRIKLYQLAFLSKNKLVLIPEINKNAFFNYFEN